MITDFRLKVFETVARRLSFTRAAEELFITQPAVTRHIREMEVQLDQQLFKRNGRSIELTSSGNRLLDHVKRILREYDLLNESMLSEGVLALTGQLILGASTTASQYLLPPILALFNRSYPDISVKLINGNSDDIEQAVVGEAVHLGIIEGIAHHPDIHYQPFLKDEVILIRAATDGRDNLRAEDLKHIPLIMREEGSGTRRIVEQALKKQGLLPGDLHVPMFLGNTESIKLYLRNSPAYAFVSSLAVREELNSGLLHRVPVRDFQITRAFHFAQAHGTHRKLTDLFIRFCLNHYNNL